MLKFLIDECLSPDLAHLARSRGYQESFHVSWLGKAGWKDWELKDLILQEDWTFVTRNSVDFRGPAERPGSAGQYQGVPIHAGLVCINGPTRMSAKIQAELFGSVLDAIQDPLHEQIPSQADLVNEVIEVNLAEEGAEFEILRYRYRNLTNRKSEPDSDLRDGKPEVLRRSDGAEIQNSFPWTTLPRKSRKLREP